MLRNRILSTLRFFDLQEYPLTLQEICGFLIVDLEKIKSKLDREFNLIGNPEGWPREKVSLEEVNRILNEELAAQVQNLNGFYFLSGRSEIVRKRLENYLYVLKRERLIKKYVWPLKHFPFVRGIALGGSQALGPGGPNSDIDLFIITDKKFLALARTLITIYFQLTGKRRHGSKVANRFCLNHYVSHPKELKVLRNFYSAMEYLRLRPLVYGQAIQEFKIANRQWMSMFFEGAAQLASLEPEKQSSLQHALEKLFNNSLGTWLEKFLSHWQVKKITTGKFIVVEEDEFSFHPNSKQQGLLADFFKL